MILSIYVINFLTILALILKIIGIVLLSVLGFILLLFVLVFLVPIRYRVSAQNDKEDMTAVLAEGKITYLLHIISVYFKYTKETGSFYRVKLFGIGIMSSDKPKNPKKKKRKNSDEEEYYEDPEGLSGLQDFSNEDNTNESDADTSSSNTDTSTDDKENVADSVEEPTGSETDKPGKKKKNKKEKKPKKPKKKRKKSDGSSPSKVDFVKDKIEELKKIINNPGNRKLFTKLKKNLFYLLKHYLPRKLTGNLSFGFDKPDMTGKILGVMSCFPFLYHNGFKVNPDFETDKLYFCGQLNAKGKIRLIHLLKVVMVLLLDKDFRRVVFKKKLY